MLPGLAVLASAQWGAFTFAQARECGYSEGEVRARVRSGQWVRLARGGYATAATLARGKRSSALAVIAARHLAAGPSAVISHRSAAIAHGLDLLGPLPGPTHMTRSAGSRAVDGVRLHRGRLRPDEVMTIGRLPVTSPLRTLVDVAASEPFRAAVVVADSALRLGPIERKDLPVEHRSTAVRRVAGFADGRSENPGESISRVAIHAAGLPAPDLQVWVADRGPDGPAIRVDFLWRSARLVGEFDGDGKLTDRAALIAEKRREDRLRAMGFLVVRWNWREAFSDFDRVAARLRAALAERAA